MIEQVYSLSHTDEKTIARILFDENINFIQMVLPQNEGLPIHNSNSTVYMTVVRGTLSIRLDEQEVRRYEAGTLLKIPNKTRMDVKNIDQPTLELFVVKAPAPVA